VRTQKLPLLQLDPDLGNGALPDSEAARREVTVLTLAPGSWTFDGPRGSLVLVTAGMLVRELRLIDRVCAELVGPGDVLDTNADPESLLAVSVGWNVVSEARIAVLDEATLRALPPGVAANLAQRIAERASRLAISQAIAQLPRIESRLLALFAHLADRWGRMTPQGVIVALGLTHETLGSLVGAARPTVSMALKALAADGSLQRCTGGWRLDVDRLDELFPAAGRAPRVPVVSLLPDGNDPSATLEPVTAGPTEPPEDAAQLHAPLERLRLRAEAQRRRPRPAADTQHRRLRRDLDPA
jgi:CRP-like cAMP-binding protein